MAGVHPRAAPQGSPVDSLVRRTRSRRHGPLSSRRIKGQVDAEDGRDARRDAGLDKTHRTVDTVAIGERKRGLTVLDRARDELGRHRCAVAQRIGRCHVEVSEIHGTRLTPSPAGTAAGRCAAGCTPGRGRSRRRGANRQPHAG